MFKFKKNVSIVLLSVFICSNTIFSSVVSDYDGQSFVPKKDFENLKAELDEQIESYSHSIDNKIDGAIATYIAAIRVAKMDVTSTLNSFQVSRRTFYNVINNPTSSAQADLYISTAGLWTWSQPTSSPLNAPWDFIEGYSFAGLNNYAPPGYGGHQKWLVELDNGKSGKYMFTDKKTITKKDKSTTEIEYIYDDYRKDLKYKIVSVGCYVADAASDLNLGRSLTLGADGSFPVYGGPSSLSWTNRYNWSGQNERSTGAGKTVMAQEALILVIENDDYNSSVTGVNPVSWVSGLSGSSIFTTNLGCLRKSNQYAWDYHITNFSIGSTAQQSLFWHYYTNFTKNGTNYTRTYSNSYNNAGNKIPLSFYVPTITLIKGNELAVLDVSDKILDKAYYYSGIPICDVPKDASSITIKLKATVNKLISTAGSSGITLAVKGSQFGNKAISSETASEILYSNTYAANSIPDEIEIFLDEDKVINVREKTLWLKGIAANTNCSVTFESSKIYYTN